MLKRIKRSRTQVPVDVKGGLDRVLEEQAAREGLSRAMYIRHLIVTHPKFVAAGKKERRSSNGNR